MARNRTAVTVLGTGLMGAGMARSLARDGLAVTVWNRSHDKAEALAGVPGIHVAEDVPSAVSAAGIVVTMLFDADAVRQVMEQALPAMPPSAVWVQSSTVGLDGAAMLARLAEQHRVPLVDAPVLGTRQPAERGQLIVLASGPTAVRDAISPVLDAIGSRTIWVNEQPGGGQRLKLVANSWVLSVNAATAQAVALSDGLDLDPRQFFELISGGPLDCGYAQLKGKTMIEEDFSPAFPLSGAAKDAGLIVDALNTAKTDDRLMRALRELYQSAVAAGHSDEDMAVVVRTFRQ